MSKDHEADKSSTQETQWSLQDYLLVSLAMLIKVGDGVEGYLPGVITQKVSCELGLSDFQEGVLAVVLIFFWTISILVSMPIANRLGERITLFLSLYLSIIFAVLCAFVPNYYTLLLSRALTGICAGLNSSVTSIFLAKHVSSKDVLTKSSFLAESMSFAVGGTWVSLLGWLCLDIVGWRIFILLTSIHSLFPRSSFFTFASLISWWTDMKWRRNRGQQRTSNQRKLTASSIQNHLKVSLISPQGSLNQVCLHFQIFALVMEVSFSFLG